MWFPISPNHSSLTSKITFLPTKCLSSPSLIVLCRLSLASLLLLFCKSKHILISPFYFLKRNTCIENNQTALQSLNEWLLFSAHRFLQLCSESLPWKESLCFKASVIVFHVAKSWAKTLKGHWLLLPIDYFTTLTIRVSWDQNSSQRNEQTSLFRRGPLGVQVGQWGAYLGGEP